MLRQPVIKAQHGVNNVRGLPYRYPAASDLPLAGTIGGFTSVADGTRSSTARSRDGKTPAPTPGAGSSTSPTATLPDPGRAVPLHHEAQRVYRAGLTPSIRVKCRVRWDWS